MANQHTYTSLPTQNLIVPEKRTSMDFVDTWDNLDAMSTEAAAMDIAQSWNVWTGTQAMEFEAPSPQSPLSCESSVDLVELQQSSQSHDFQRMCCSHFSHTPFASAASNGWLPMQKSPETPSAAQPEYDTWFPASPGIIKSKDCPPLDDISPIESPSGRSLHSYHSQRSPSKEQQPSLLPKQALPRPKAQRKRDLKLENLPTIIRQVQFRCSEPGCQGRFKRQEHLKRHMKSHSNEKPHVCWVPGCNRSFSRNDNLNVHYSTTHGRRGGRNRYVATLDEKSAEYDPDFRGDLTSDGRPVRHPPATIAAVGSFQESSYPWKG